MPRTERRKGIAKVSVATFEVSSLSNTILGINILTMMLSSKV